MSPLHNRRRVLADLAAREAAGESFWSDDFGQDTRNRIHHVIARFQDNYGAARTEARRLILEDEGWRQLTVGASKPAVDFDAYLVNCPSNMVPTVIEAMYQALGMKSVRDLGAKARSGYADAINTVLQEDRISYELSNGEMIPFSSKELHVEVVVPVLHLIGKAGWEKVENAYRAALSELARGEGANAITDAGTALQEALWNLGAEGNALGPLIASAQKKGLIASHDQALAKTAHWVSADRSVSGDAHTASAASVQDAWLTVHVVGALILRLASGAPRSGVS